jgi:hypothetical protein
MEEQINECNSSVGQEERMMDAGMQIQQPTCIEIPFHTAKRHRKPNCLVSITVASSLQERSRRSEQSEQVLSTSSRVNLHLLIPIATFNALRRTSPRQHGGSKTIFGSSSLTGYGSDYLWDGWIL